MRPWRHVLEVVLALLVSDAVAPVLEIDTHALHTRGLQRVDVASAVDHSSQDEGPVAIEHLLNANRAARGIGDHVARTRCRGAVRDGVALDAHADGSHIAQGHLLSRPQVAAIEGQRASIRADPGIRHLGGFELIASDASRACLVAQASRQDVCDPGARNDAAGARVFEHQGVLNKIAGRSQRSKGRLLQEKPCAGRIKRHIDIRRGGVRYRVRVPERPRIQTEWSPRQGLQRGRIRGGREAIADRRTELEPIASRRDNREAEGSGRERIARAT